MRKLVATLACRSGGKRLHGKPLQNLAPSTTILKHLVNGIRATKEIDEIVLGISEGAENHAYIEFAKQENITYIVASEKDVLWRLIMCGRVVAATDIFRVTTECPFICWELLGKAWKNHMGNVNDITTASYLPEGLGFEIVTQESLEHMHKHGNDYERSEYCCAYSRRKPEEFKKEIIKPLIEWQRFDIRLTVDNPEDLILCRQIYQALYDNNPHIPVQAILNWIDENPEAHKIVEPFVEADSHWLR
jgi:spore coat polysaccharide biosynthesis protein SpsF